MVLQDIKKSFENVHLDIKIYWISTVTLWNFTTLVTLICSFADSYIRLYNVKIEQSFFMYLLVNDVNWYDYIIGWLSPPRIISLLKFYTKIVPIQNFSQRTLDGLSSLENIENHYCNSRLNLFWIIHLYMEPYHYNKGPCSQK